MAAFWDKEELCGKVKKNNREEIQIKKVSKNNKDYIDIRVFWYDAEGDDFKPSQKGLTIPIESFAEVKEILVKIV